MRTLLTKTRNPKPENRNPKGSKWKLFAIDGVEVEAMGSVEVGLGATRRLVLVAGRKGGPMPGGNPNHAPGLARPGIQTYVKWSDLGFTIFRKVAPDRTSGVS